MGQSSATPPAPPGLSQEEKDLLAKQGITLDKFQQILDSSSLDAADTQALLRQLSGLYKQETVPGTKKPGTPITTINQGLIDAGVTSLSSNSRLQYVIAPDQKPITMSELQRARTDLAYAQSRGYTTTTMGPDIITPDTTKWALDPVAVEDLKKRIAAETATQQKIADLSNQRYIDALEGKTPLSSGLLQQKQTDFRLLREAAARRGIVIDGEDPTTATSQSTAGNELVGQFKRTYGLLEDSERRAVIEGGAPQMTPTSSIPLSYATNATASGPVGLLPTYSNLSSQYAGAGSPYQQQRMLGYQGQIASYNAGQQGRGAVAGLLGTGAGYALMSGHPYVAAGLGLAGLGAAYL